MDWTSASAVAITSAGDHRSGSRLLVREGEHVGGELGEPAVDLGAQLPVDPVQALLGGLAVVGLGAAGGEGGLAVQPVQLKRVRGAAVLGLERLDQLGGLRGDRPPPRGEQVR